MRDNADSWPLGELWLSYFALRCKHQQMCTVNNTVCFLPAKLLIAEKKDFLEEDELRCWRESQRDCLRKRTIISCNCNQLLLNCTCASLLSSSCSSYFWLFSFLSFFFWRLKKCQKRHRTLSNLRCDGESRIATDRRSFQSTKEGQIMATNVCLKF